MCIVFYTLNHPGYKLILASNRDEFLDRPTLPARWHKFEPIAQSDTPTHVDTHHDPAPLAEPEEPWVLSGRDTGNPSGGTWLGMTRDLRLAVLTNIRIPPVPTPPNAPSRGLLLKSFLAAPPSSSHPSVHEYLSRHKPEVDQYEGFNLLLFHLHPPSSPSSSSLTPANGASTATSSTQWSKPEIGYLSNRPGPTMTDVYAASTRPSTPLGSDPTPTSKPVGHCYGLSNSPMAEPWPKVLKGEEKMTKTLAEWTQARESQDQLIERLMQLLQQSVPLDSLASLQDCTCLHPIALGRNPDAPIKPGEPGRWYGTRVTTVILVKDSGEVTFVERDIFVQNEAKEAVRGTQERKYHFQAHSK